MELNIANSLMRLQEAAATQDLVACNEVTARYGLSLTQEQMRGLVERRQTALRATGRVEFGRGVLCEIALGFCDSPFVDQGNYEDTLADVQDVFYRRKEDSDSGEPFADDDLIAALRHAFDHEAHGSTDLLVDMPLERLRSYAAGRRAGDYDQQTQLDAFEAKEEEDDDGRLRDEIDRVYDEDRLERPGNDYALGFYDGCNELYRIGFDSNSRIGGSSLGL